MRARIKVDMLSWNMSKYKAKKTNLVGHSLMKPIDVDELFSKRVIFHELEASLNDD